MLCCVVCVCVHVCEYARDTCRRCQFELVLYPARRHHCWWVLHECACACVSACVCACVCMCVCRCVHVCVSVCAYACDTCRRCQFELILYPARRRHCLWARASVARAWGTDVFELVLQSSSCRHCLWVLYECVCACVCV